MGRYILSLHHLLFSSLLIFILMLNHVHASKNCYIVYMGAHSHGPTPTSVDLETATSSHYDLLGSIVGSKEEAKEAIIYSYNKQINGFAAMLEEEEAAQLAKNPKVVSVFLSKEHKLHTTRSWEFLGLHGNDINSAWQKGRFGENTIIANIDTGVWPESRSFSDRGIGPIPAKWRGGNVCQINKLRGSKKVPCNRKLIGARFFSDAYERYNGKLPTSQRTARDFVGHGTHTLSTAGGNFVPGASIFNIGNGTIKGGSPRARVATYKVCWSLTDAASCFGADVLSAIDQAIDDGVDIISVSAGGPSSTNSEEIFTDEVSIGAFHALARNILLVASAGNEGPTPGSVVNVAPWVFTVAASTIDRDFSSTITIGDQIIRGASLFVDLPPNQSFTLVNSIDAKFSNATTRDARFCRPRTLDPSKVKGKIVACAREGKIKSVAEGQEALSAGAKGMFLENQPKVSGNTLLSEPHVLSTVGGNGQAAITAPPRLGVTATDTIESGTKIRFSQAITLIGRKPAPVMASFSSRGPNQVQPYILKPDVTAPGVNILAAYSLFASASNLLTDNRRGFPFNVMQGTSMSCPHVAGTAGLIKTLHPNWSPAAIKSAIMTTATTRDNTNKPISDAFDKTLADPFAYGSGHIQPNSAIDPGLVYDLGIKDYLNFLCASGYNKQLISALNFNMTFTCSGTHSIDDLNYPSITLPNLGLNAITVTRTVTNVGPPSTYFAKVQLPGYKIAVVPSSLNFKKIGEKKTFQVIVQATSEIPRRKYQFGELRWTNGKHIVRSPVTVQRK
ncbi:putative tripeptidyl-peptidase II [Medicago truncatula]|uniref:Putative tripeptidyl-peptidase II n=1 Tax=Medicago truncatula TaxID=3880 RepID=G7KTF0_MEDTR|nr:subtilisin-like protease Glyma18g48580 isoform X3 [Medicago truncatula]AES80518.1 subtilisin-like serine protease [Medicago truncatula]RHN47202.1 putative tripeptidyl-peptidase II [Medicago truncatula]